MGTRATAVRCTQDETATISPLSSYLPLLSRPRRGNAFAMPFLSPCRFCSWTSTSSCCEQFAVCESCEVGKHVRGSAPAAPAAQQVVEQQIAQTKQVILVPQQVYVPFVQATNFGAVRVNGLQQTQF